MNPHLEVADEGRGALVLGVGHDGVLGAGDGALLEFHDVPGERAGLVGEDVLDLSQLLVEIGRPRVGVGLQLLVVQLLVLDDKVRLILDFMLRFNFKSKFSLFR